MTKPSAELTLFDTLSRMTFARLTKLLGAEGDLLIAAGGRYDVDITTQVEFDRDRFRPAVDLRGISTRPAYQRHMAFRNQHRPVSTPERAAHHRQLPGWPLWVTVV